MNLTKSNWDEFYGNNHKVIDSPTIKAGGEVSFKRHLGLPLSQRLWEDLIHRMSISGLCIYGPNDMQWTIGWMPGHCCIELDEKDNVEDIHFCPYYK